MEVQVYIWEKVAVTELPQTVAAFHALVGLAAVATSIGSYYIHAVDVTTLHKVASYIGTLIGGITFTGSIAAFIKLSGRKFTFDLPMKRHLNLPLGLLNLAAFGAIIASKITYSHTSPLVCNLFFFCSRMEYHKFDRCC